MIKTTTTKKMISICITHTHSPSCASCQTPASQRKMIWPSGCYFCLCHDLTRSLGKCSYWPPKCWDWLQRSWAVLLIRKPLSFAACREQEEKIGRKRVNSGPLGEKNNKKNLLHVNQTRWIHICPSWRIPPDLQWPVNPLSSRLKKCIE